VLEQDFDGEFAFGLGDGIDDTLPRFDDFRVVDGFAVKSGENGDGFFVTATTGEPAWGLG